MDSESQTFGVCSIPYDTKNHTPRILTNCGHTLCSSCLIEIIKTPQLRKCPFDNHVFHKTQKSLEKFHLNFALLDLLERKNTYTCKIHGEELKIFCLKDKMKICSECAFLGEHKEHATKWIKELKAQGVKLKRNLEESLMKFEINQFERDQDAEALKKEVFNQMGDKFEEFKKVLRMKELEWKKQVENLFKGTIGSNSGSLLKIEAEKALEEIDQACQKEENLGILNRDFSSIISRLQPQGAKDELLKLSDETSKMMDCIGSLLTGQAKPIKNYDLLEERRKSEQLLIKQEELSSETFIESKQKPELFNSLLAFRIHKELLSISVTNPDPIIQTIDLEEFNKMKIIKAELERYESLFQEGSTDLTALSVIFLQLDSYTSLIVVFLPSGLTDDRALYLFNLLFCRVYQLTEIEICLDDCKITNEPILFFCSDILPKATSLKYLTLRLDSTLINDESLFALAKSLSLLSLETFSLEAGDTEITDDGIEKICYAVWGVKELHLDLKGTLITDEGLKALGNNMVSCMKKLEKFFLDVSETKITIAGVKAIFTGIPQNISWLSLGFDGINLSEQVISFFEEKVCPKLKLVETVFVRFEGKILRAEVSKILERVRKDAGERRKACGIKEEEK